MNISPEDERKARAWLDHAVRGGLGSMYAGHANIIKALLARPALPAKLSQEQIKAISDEIGFGPYSVEMVHLTLVDHLTRKPTKTVETYHVEWSEKLPSDTDWRLRMVGPFTSKRMADGCADDLAVNKFNARIRVTGPHRQEVPCD